MKKILLFLLISSSAWAQQPKKNKYNYDDFNLLVKVEDKEKYYQEMLREKPEDKTKVARYNDYRSSLAVGWLAKGNLEKYRYYTKSHPEFSFIELLDFTYALEYLVEDSKNLNLVEQVSREYLDRLDKVKTNDELTLDRMRVLLEVNAMANAKLGNVTTAMKNITRSSTIKSMRDAKYFKDSKSNYLNRYAIVLAAAGQQQKALDLLIEAVRNADSNPKLVATLREVYKKVNGNEDGLQELIKSLQDVAYQKYYKEVEKLYIADSKIPFQGTMLDPNDNTKKIPILTAKQHAKDISLIDLDGKTVNFSDYKGKIMVIDFWTTGCTPCVSAFAGFEKVVADYKKEEFQLFVVNLYEEQPAIKSFIAKRGITLDVLRDEPNKTYDIQATPTKIVFDPMGNIRFYSVSYAGSTDREYYKLKAMVEIIKANS
ncbi:Peroxiredoxin [Pedobacter terrae]|uniref:Peroxiredoxin n=1 Tax=Pedobacter terrae TaxID=405671 RepID=A0A1G8BSP1_9SPHI|nr:TlpA disulfide reductase family protein [Pedobacter terrae]SDH36235.1 Peroxiredoxin [Pedobacter terrae]